MTMVIRPIRADDAAAIEAMAIAFGAYLISLGDSWSHRFTQERILADGFGPDPAFGGFIAEGPSEALGYVLLAPNYDVDLAMRIEIVIDLWVQPAARGRGVGRALMRRAADHARAKGAGQLLWNVFKPNRPAYDFYRAIGARPVEQLDWMYLEL